MHALRTDGYRAIRARDTADDRARAADAAERTRALVAPHSTRTRPSTSAAVGSTFPTLSPRSVPADSLGQVDLTAPAATEPTFPTSSDERDWADGVGNVDRASSCGVGPWRPAGVAALEAEAAFGPAPADTDAPMGAPARAGESA
ncbi:hypothetical protein QN358_01440 [Subtercola sp. RTI3]|nr:hypothetical protein [Subtercola sp. RTI3]